MEDELHQGGIDVSWSKITSELKKSLDKDTFQNWIKPIYFESHIDTSLTLSVPTIKLSKVNFGSNGAEMSS